jgi:hypothetical protein
MTVDELTKITKIDFETRLKFERAIDGWAEYCEKTAHLSSPHIDCEPYKTLVKMGPKILPLIRETYEPDYQRKRGVFIQGFESMLFLQGILVKQLVGNDFQIPKDACGKVDKLKEITINWLDSNMHRYS